MPDWACDVLRDRLRLAVRGTFAASLAVVGLEAAILNEWEHGEETGQSIDHPSAALRRNSTPRAT